MKRSITAIAFALWLVLAGTGVQTAVLALGADTAAPECLQIEDHWYCRCDPAVSVECPSDDCIWLNGEWICPV